MKTEAEKPFLVVKEVPVCQGLTTEILARHVTVIFWSTIHGPQFSRMGVIKLPKSFHNLLANPEFTKVFAVRANRYQLAVHEWHRYPQGL